VSRAPSPPAVRSPTGVFAEMEESGDDLLLVPPPAPAPGVFSFASGRAAAAVSAAAAARAAALLADVDGEAGSSSVAGAPRDPSPPPPPPPPAGAFLFASGRAAAASAAATARAASLLADLVGGDDEGTPGPLPPAPSLPPPPAPPPGAFLLASGAGVTVSEEARTRAAALLRSPEAETEAAPAGAWSTGAGAPAPVSAAAVARARDLLEGTRTPPPPPPPPAPGAGGGWATGAGATPRPVSDAALAASRALLGDSATTPPDARTPLGDATNAPRPRPLSRLGGGAAAKRARAAPSTAPPAALGRRRGFVPPARSASASPAVVARMAAATPAAPSPGARAPRLPLHALGATLSAWLRAAAAAGGPAPPLPPCVRLPDEAFAAGGDDAPSLPAGPLGPPGARAGPAALRAALLAAGADPALASPAWVANATRWVAWKLAGLDAAFPALAGVAATGPVAVDALAYRYEREHGRGHRPHLARVLEGDTPAGAPAVFRVARILVPPPRVASPGEPALELTDGWYGVRAAVDAPLAAAVAGGRVRVGAKVAVAGARLAASAPDEALRASETAMLALTHNCVAPAPAGARLGATRGPPRVRPLTRVDPDGGPVAATAFVVRRLYPDVVWQALADGRCETVTPRAAAAAADAAASAADAVAADVAAALHREDAAAAASAAEAVDAGDATEGEAAFAREWAAAAAVADDGPPAVPASLRAASSALDRFCAARDRAREARAAQLRGEALAAAGAAPPERARRIVRALVSPALPAGGSSSMEDEWILNLWEPPDGAPALVEGAVFSARALAPRAAPRGDPAARPTLASTRGTTWAPWRGPQTAHSCPPRRLVTLAGLGALPLGADFDAGPAACVAAAPPRPSSLGRPGDMEQWVFLADGAAKEMLAAGVAPADVWLLAVRVAGGPRAAPFLVPHEAAAGSTITLRDARLAVAPDGGARLWRADARDTAVLAAAPGGGEWAVEAFGARVAGLLGE
jgi:breast cancer 2 susceptibility protein